MQTTIIIICIIYSFYISILNLINMHQKNNFQRRYFGEFCLEKRNTALYEKYKNDLMEEKSKLYKLENIIDEIKELAFNKHIDTNVEIKDKIKEILLNPENYSNIPETEEPVLFDYMNSK